MGNIVSPFIVTISDKIGVQAIFVGGVVCFAGALVMMLAKETLVKKKEGEEEEVGGEEREGKESLITESMLENTEDKLNRT